MFKGVATAMITPFENTGEIDYDAMHRFIEFQIKAHIDALVVLGTTGEASTVSDEERMAIIKFVIEKAAGRTKIIVGTGTNDTKKVTLNNKMAQELGADGVLIVNPYYNKSSQAGIFEHYKYISQRTELPIILYNVPSRTGMNISPETAVKIAQACPNVVGIKEASGNISQIATLMSIKPQELKVYSGNDDQTVPVMALGGDGVISVFSNICPVEMKWIADSILNNDMQTARNINNKYLELMNLLFVDVNPVPVKYAASLMNFTSDYVRLPLIPLSDKHRQVLSDKMKELNIVCC